MIRWFILPLLIVAATAHAEPVQRARLAASLFGETVGEIHLTRKSGAETTITYRSDLLVVRDRVRLRQQAFIESTYESQSGRLIESVARRCSGPADGSTAPVCTPRRQLSGSDAVPAMAAELLLARDADGRRHCLNTIDEETALLGPSCATAVLREGGVELEGRKLGEPFTARVEDGMLVRLDLPRQGAHFVRATGAIAISDEDLFAEPIPSGGDAAEAIRQGLLRIRVFGPPEPLQSLRAVSAPGQRTLSSDGESLLIEIRQLTPGRALATRQLLGKVALVVAKAAGSHVDCQAATAWFLAEAHRRHWSARAVTGFAFVDGRFAYHAWAVVDTPAGPIPVDPLLAQVPADAGHVALTSPGESAGSVLASFHGGLTLSVESCNP